MHFRPKLANYHKQLSLINLQNQIENDEPVDTLYFGNKDITTAMEKLKAELSQALIDTNQTINDGKGTVETIEANEIIVLENQEKELSMDC